MSNVEPLGVPRWVMVTLIVTAVLGLPVAAALAWFYEAGDQGIERDTSDDGVPRPRVSGLRRNADIAIIGVLLATVALLLVRQSELVEPVQRKFNDSRAAFPEPGWLGQGRGPGARHRRVGSAPDCGSAQLDVISRTSSFAFRNRAEDSREIGRQLGARYLLEGSVQGDRTQLRITAQLIDTATGADVWSMRFDRPAGDIFVVQDEIAVQVTQALELSVDPAAMERMTGQGTLTLNAYLAFLQGRALLANNRLEDASEAVGYFERAVKSTRASPPPMSAWRKQFSSSASTKSAGIGRPALRTPGAAASNLSTRRSRSIRTAAPRICNAPTCWPSSISPPPRRTTAADSN